MVLNKAEAGVDGPAGKVRYEVSRLMSATMKKKRYARKSRGQVCAIAD